MLKANENAFHAYKILYYDIDPNWRHLDTVPSEKHLAQALTVQENLAGTPYQLSDASLAALAAYYAHCNESNDVLVPMVDPAADIRRFEPDASGKPMYPDFPSQVKEMSEDDFRADQIKHYFSTYGVEQIFAMLGQPVTVMKGWRPESDGTEKTRQDDVLAEAQVVDIVFGIEAMMRRLASELSRPTRMSGPAITLFVELFADARIVEVPKISFHENMMEIIRQAAAGSSRDLSDVATKLCQHPGDALKAVLWTTGKNKVKHLATKQKKGFCRVLERFDAVSIAENMADLGAKGAKAVNMLSIARFAGDNLRKAAAMVESGEVVSYNSRVEAAWREYRETSSYENLLAVYGQRPGVLLRSLARLVRNGVPASALAEELDKHAYDYSPATLVTLAGYLGTCDGDGTTTLSTKGIPQQAGTGQVEDPPHEAERRQLLAPVLSLLSRQLEKKETPFGGKKVFVEPGGFSLKGSVIVPNEQGNTADAYPPVGMAYDVPADETVRFFTFWNDRSSRVDVDIHFMGRRADGSSIHIGWNANYDTCGMTTSGDITDSIDAAEYLDIDMEEAAASGVSFVYQHQHIFSGRENWKDIEECFSGALVVHDKAKDVALYRGENVIFRDDMAGDGRNMDYALIDVPGHWVRILRGAKMPFRNTEFTLASYINLLLDAQGCQQVDSREEAECVLSVGRSSEEGDICLIDEGFFI